MAASNFCHDKKSDMTGNQVITELILKVRNPRVTLSLTEFWILQYKVDLFGKLPNIVALRSGKCSFFWEFLP